ncbi:hypothetical protein FB451DRAFT_1168319 [Mycena latifolia]|nr:hypothetical protein FB451DRAFT_1168319 [Mycena latifolia]
MLPALCRLELLISSWRWGAHDSAAASALEEELRKKWVAWRVEGLVPPHLVFVSPTSLASDEPDTVGLGAREFNWVSLPSSHGTGGTCFSFSPPAAIAEVPVNVTEKLKQAADHLGIIIVPRGRVTCTGVPQWGDVPASSFTQVGWLLCDSTSLHVGTDPAPIVIGSNINSVNLDSKEGNSSAQLLSAAGLFGDVVSTFLQHENDTGRTLENMVYEFHIELRDIIQGQLMHYFTIYHPEPNPEKLCLAGDPTPAR